MSSPRRREKWRNPGYQAPKLKENKDIKRINGHISEDDISVLLDRWHEAKQDLKDLEEKIEKYKKVATKLMKDSDSNVIFGVIQDYFSKKLYEIDLTCLNIGSKTARKIIESITIDN